MVKHGSGQDVDAVALLGVAPQQRPLQVSPNPCRTRSTRVTLTSDQRAQSPEALPEARQRKTFFLPAAAGVWRPDSVAVTTSVRPAVL